MSDFWNIFHFAGGVSAAGIVIAICHNRCQHWATILFASLSGFAVNLFWELVIDVYGWFSFLGMRGDADVGDILRGGGGGVAIALLYLFYLRKQKGTWKLG
jgi:hypothetical protein